MRISKATPDDIDYILDMYLRGVRENGEHGVESFMVKTILTAMQLAPCFLLIINDTICGMVGLSLARSSHNGDATVVDYMVYVYPKHRNIRNLTGLIEESKRFASSHKLPLRFDFLLNNDEPLKRRLFKIHNFKISSLVGVYNG